MAQDFVEQCMGRYAHWRRQLWGTGARAPSTSNSSHFSGHFRVAQTLNIRLHAVDYPVKCTGLIRAWPIALSQCLLHEFHNIFVRHP